MSRRTKPVVLEPVIPVEMNGRNGVHPPTTNHKTPTPDWIEITGKRKQVIRLRLSAVDAVWEDRGALDGPFFVQAGGRTFHPNEESFAAVTAALEL